MLLVGDGVKNRSTAYQPLRGTNKSEYHDAVITLGRDEPSVRDAEQRAMAIWYGTKEPIGCIPEVPVRELPEARAALFDAQRRHQESGGIGSSRCPRPRSERPLAECDARDWDALPLAPKHLTRSFPALWDTTKAAECWIAKNPQRLLEI